MNQKIKLFLDVHYIWLANSLIQLCSIPLCSTECTNTHTQRTKHVHDTTGARSMACPTTKKDMLDLMTTAAGENEVLPDLEEALGVRSEVVRQLPLNQRERKAGCRNFYWKTFTSC
uniref:Somatostatin/Cortistatin C-terminal domain-containing protein n=1 Tax=Oncorhynchus kisutch TaxID=8019 RepID=A0A8C7G0M5_ONCKI